MEKNSFPEIPNECKIDAGQYALLERSTGRALVIDMGCGHGDFLIAEAPKRPDCFFVGIEIARKRAHKTATRLAKRDIRNFAIVSFDGQRTLRELFPASSVDAIHLNFPDPWLRPKHWKHRLLRPSFVVDMLRVLKPQATIHLVTDVEAYAQSVACLLSAFPRDMESVYQPVVRQNIYERFPTLFYEKMHPLRDIHYLCFQRK